MKTSKKFERRLLKGWNRSLKQRRRVSDLGRSAGLATVGGALSLGIIAMPSDARATIISGPISGPYVLVGAESLDVTAAGSTCQLHRPSKATSSTTAPSSRPMKA